MTYFTVHVVAIACVMTIGNFVASAFGAPTTEQAAERSFFQVIALAMLWLSYRGEVK